MQPFVMPISKCVCLIIFVTHYATAQTQVQSRIVQISQGPVRGYKDAEFDIYTFYGIPYATIPMGRDRFKAPLAPPTWSEPFEASNSHVMCHQSSTDGTVDDCLVANIFVPDVNATNLPVLVSIHGGGYVMGFAHLVQYKNLIKTRDMVVVTFNYRLGPLGFLCLGTEDVPGNAGLKDQVTLLRWVQTNIAAFGGNPQDVTALGYSAGSSALDLLMLSDTTKDLFNKAILESGSNVGYWSVQMDPIRHAKNFAEQLHFSDVNDLSALEEFYKTISLNELNSINPSGIFSPCIEKDLGQEMIITESPVNAITNKRYRQIPILYGFANMEGIMQLETFRTLKDMMNNNFELFIPTDLEFENADEKTKVANKVKEFYFKNKTVSEESILGFVDFFTDTMFAYPALRSVTLQRDAGNDQIYLYKYSFTDDDSPMVPYVNIRGATHCAQTIAVSDSIRFAYHNETGISEEYQQMKTMMRTMWSNFIVDGHPVINATSEYPVWPPMASYKPWSPFMLLELPLRLEESLLGDRAAFWDEIYEKHYIHPIPPSTGASNMIVSSFVLLYTVILLRYLI